MATEHNAILENREKLQLSGVTAIDSFDDRAVVLYTNCGQLTILGRNLQMQQINVETGDVTVEGEVQAMRYSDRDRTAPTGLLGRMLR
ncbi:MAG: sporulation protein YabP [Oscillospiraceae bacterium]|nr:sporulation protein YabP [Oscillospiraceae bacterium]